MSGAKRLRPDEVWDAILDSAIEEEAARVEGLREEELDRELAAGGRDPQEERARGTALAERLGAGAGQVAQVLQLPVRPRPRGRVLVWLAAAALGAGALVLVIERNEVVAWFKGDTRIEPDHPVVPREPTPEERAEKLRDEAEKACAEERWGRCNDRLDEATKLDPAGETGARVQALRATIKERTTLKKDSESKLKPGK